jgi:hypothetical protein
MNLLSIFYKNKFTLCELLMLSIIFGKFFADLFGWFVFRISDRDDYLLDFMGLLFTGMVPVLIFVSNYWEK